MRAQSTGSQSLKVSWAAPRPELRHGQLVGYYIGYKVAGSDDQFQYKHYIPEPEEMKQPTFTTYLTNLKRLTRYRVTVQAYNKAGLGPLSDGVEATTLETSPPISPSVRIISTSNSSITVIWERDEKDKSITAEYTLHYKEDNRKDWKEIRVSPNLHEYHLQSLLCGTRYQLYMTATNSLGTGEPGATVSTRTKGAGECHTTCVRCQRQARNVFHRASHKNAASHMIQTSFCVATCRSTCVALVIERVLGNQRDGSGAQSGRVERRRLSDTLFRHSTQTQEFEGLVGRARQADTSWRQQQIPNTA